MPFKTALKILLPACLLLVVCIQCVIFFLPDISKQIIHSTLGPLPGNQPFDFTVSRIGVNDTQISDISLGEDLRLDTIRFTCRMDAKNIISVEEIVISGLNATLHLDEKKRIRVSGFSFSQDKEADHSGPVFDISAFESYFAYLPGHIVLKNSTIVIDTGKDRLCIPVAADVQLDRDKRLADMKLSILPMNQKITLGATADLLHGPVKMKISADCLYPQMLLGMVPGRDLFRGKFCGPVNFEIETQDFSKFYFELNDLGLEPDPGLKINFPKISGILSSDKTAMALKADGPVKISTPGINWGPFKFEILSQIESGTVEHFSLTFQNAKIQTWDIRPGLIQWPLSLDDFSDQIQVLDPQLKLFVSGDLEHQTGTLAFSGTGLNAFGHNETNHSDLFDISGLQVNTEFDGNFGRFGSLKHIKLDALIEKIAFQQNIWQMKIASLNASSDAGFTFLNSGIVLDNANTKIIGHSIHLKQNDNSADIPELNIETVVKKGRSGKDLIIDVNAVCNKTKIVSKQATAFVGKAGITGRIEKPTSFDISFQLTPFLYDTAVTIKNKGVQAKGVYFKLPVTYPFKNTKAFGRAGAKKIILHDKVTPAVSAKVVQASNLTMDILGKVTNTGFPGLVIDFSARTGLDSAMSPFAKGKVATNGFSITQNTLSPFLPAISGVDDLKFDISAGAYFFCTNQQINSSADIHLANGILESLESGFSASGISADIHFNDLMVPETLPGQYINIDAFNAGRFNFNNGKIRFSLEDGKTINIENLKFNWCNGIVSTEAFRLPSDDNDIHLTLYCDRLGMEDLFHQLGAFDAEGGGTLSGRIPVVIKNTEIGFDKGFLFSTPGEGGLLFIRDLGRMLAGIPKNTPEFSQLDLAGEALKNFEYKWVTLKLNTHGDTLAVNMQLDGKPVSALPFKYSRKLNSFVRVNAQSSGSNFQGIKLDVNLTLPFNQVIQFGNNLRHIMNP